MVRRPRPWNSNPHSGAKIMKVKAYWFAFRVWLQPEKYICIGAPFVDRMTLWQIIRLLRKNAKYARDGCRDYRARILCTNLD